MNKQLTDKNVSCVLIDISGVLKEGKTIFPQAVEGFKKLVASNIPQILCTNDSSKMAQDLKHILSNGGIHVDLNLIYTPVEFCIKYVHKNRIIPFINTNSRLKECFKREFPNLFLDNMNCSVDQFTDENEYNFQSDFSKQDSIILSDQKECLNFFSMNKCFRILSTSQKPLLLTMGNNQYQKGGDGHLSMDNYGFTKGLIDCAEKASNLSVNLVVGGKPNEEQFQCALKALNEHWNTEFKIGDNIVMIGDDLEGDVQGAFDASLTGVLVRTGKFMDSWEHETSFIQNDFLEFINDVTK